MQFVYAPEEFIDTFGEYNPHIAHKKYAGYLTEKGVHWVYKPCPFLLRLEKAGRWHGQSYTPTFYIPMQKRFVHIVATYSNYQDAKGVFEAFREQYPQHALAVVNYTQQQIGVNEKNAGKKCSVASCDKDAVVKGMCRACYYKWKRGMITMSGEVIGIDHRTKAARGEKQRVVIESGKKAPTRKRMRRARPAL